VVQAVPAYKVVQAVPACRREPQANAKAGAYRDGPRHHYMQVPACKVGDAAVTEHRPPNVFPIPQYSPPDFQPLAKH
jgi:hypothetical protein